MYRVVVKDKGYNSMAFRFGSMENVAVFVDTALVSAESEVEVTVELIKEGDNNDGK